jgi:glycerol uptake facilitator-like aquaporin
MFDLPVLMWGATARAGIGQWTGEAVATFGLVVTILACVRFRPKAVAAMVGLYITAAYWFTSSTSFANPAVTVARALTDSFAGIRPADVPAFILAQLAGALTASLVAGGLFAEFKNERGSATATSSGPGCLPAATKPAPQADVSEDEEDRGALAAQPEANGIPMPTGGSTS